jgi:thiol-disulfide isomerase/thioredoxin
MTDRAHALFFRRTLSTHLAASCLAAWLAAAGGCGSPTGGSKNGASKPDEAKAPTTAEEVLQAMVAAYRDASSYTDTGTVRLQADLGERKIDNQADFSVTLVRPNKLCMRVYQGKIVCDGRQMNGAVSVVPEQMVTREAPEDIALDSISFDKFLFSSMTRGFAGAAPQLLLLVDKDPLNSLLNPAEKPVLGEPGEIDGRKYFRVETKWPDGTAVFWIDKETFVLRRVVFPVGELHRMLGRPGTVKSASLTADFVGAAINGKVDPKRFEFAAAKGAKTVKCLIPPHPGQLLGKKVPDFKLANLEGNPVTAESLAGKVAVLDFWATWCGPCRQSLPNLEKVYQHYKDDKRLVFATVSVDDPQTTDKTLHDTFEEWKVHAPIVRDPEQEIMRVFRTAEIPCMFLLDGKGVVQDFEDGPNPDLAAQLPQKLEKLLAGEDIYQQPVENYQKQVKQYEKMQEEAAKAGAAGQPAVKDTEIPRAQVAARSEPRTLRLTPLWKCADLKSPGNILVVAQSDGTQRLLVVEEWRSVAEVGLDGRVIATHPLDIDTQKKECVTNLRTAVDRNGKRYYAGLASAQQRFHLFDANWKKVFSFPEDALENRHDGIADVQFGDLDGDGTPELYVGYWGVVGVQAVSLEGKRLYSNRNIAFVVRVAVGEPDAQGRRSLFCVNNNGSLVVLDDKLQKQSEVIVPDRPIGQIVSADLSGNGRLQWCGLSSPQIGDNVAIGLNLRGQELWNYTLPTGVQQQAIEPIIAGRITADLPGQWLLPGTDGSIHIVGIDGKLLDRFNSGVVLQGLATVEIDGKPALIVASSQGLEAFRVE